LRGKNTVGSRPPSRSARAVDEAAPSDASGRIDRRGLRGLRGLRDDERTTTTTTTTTTTRAVGDN